MPKIQFTGNASDFLKIGVATAARGDIPGVREILKARPKWIHKIGSHGRTMLWEACHRGKFEMVKYLVRRKADINACGTHYTPYFVEISCYCIARHKKRHDVADYLLSKGAIVNIHTAAFLGDCDAVRQFLKKKRSLLNNGHPQYEMSPSGVSPEFFLAPADWATPLCYALRGGDVETVEYLLSRKARIRGFERELFIAANDNCDMVRLLLENGASPEHAPHATPDDGKLYEIVTQYGGRAPDKHELGTELVYLCRGDRGGNPDEVRRLLQQGADVNFQDHKGKTALHRAAKSGFLPAMKILLQHKASLKLTDLKGETCLFDVVRSTIKNTDNRKKALQLLIKSGAKISHKNNKGQTPLTLATTGKTANPDFARILRRAK